MQRLRRVFELTVPEQRAIIVLLSAYLLFVVIEVYRGVRFDRAASQPNESYSSPNPGMRP